MAVTSAHSLWGLDGDIYVTARSRSLSSELRIENADSTTLADGGVRTRVPTITDQVITADTFIDEEEFNGSYMGSPPTDRWFLTCYRIPQAGDVFRAMPSLVTGSPAIGGNVGDLIQASMAWESRSKFLVQGEGASTGGVLEWTTATATGNGSGVNFGAMGANDVLYAWLGVVKSSVSGTLPTLNVTIQRSASDSWGAPTTVVTFSQATASTNTYQVNNSTTGTQAETWYRAAYTIGGTDTPTFQFFVGLGITTLT